MSAHTARKWLHVPKTAPKVAPALQNELHGLPYDRSLYPEMLPVFKAVVRQIALMNVFRRDEMVILFNIINKGKFQEGSLLQHSGNANREPWLRTVRDARKAFIKLRGLGCSKEAVNLLLVTLVYLQLVGQKISSPQLEQLQAVYDSVLVFAGKNIRIIDCDLKVRAVFSSNQVKHIFNDLCQSSSATKIEVVEMLLEPMAVYFEESKALPEIAVITQDIWAKTQQFFWGIRKIGKGSISKQQKETLRDMLENLCQSSFEIDQCNREIIAEEAFKVSVEKILELMCHWADVKCSIRPRYRYCEDGEYA